MEVAGMMKLHVAMMVTDAMKATAIPFGGCGYADCHIGGTGGGDDRCDDRDNDDHGTVRISAVALRMAVVVTMRGGLGGGGDGGGGGEADASGGVCAGW